MTNPTTDTAGRQDRFGKVIERGDGADVPFYNGQPVQVAGLKWLVIVLAAVAGFLALVLIPATGNFALLGTRIQPPEELMAILTRPSRFETIAANLDALAARL